MSIFTMCSYLRLWYKKDKSQILLQLRKIVLDYILIPVEFSFNCVEKKSQKGNKEWNSEKIIRYSLAKLIVARCENIRLDFKQIEWREIKFVK